MTVKLRGHHLLCILPYIGKGYTPAFIDNYSQLMERVGKGEVVEVVTGMDDICASLHKGDNGCYDDAGHCLCQSAKDRDKKPLQSLGLAAGQKTILDDKTIWNWRERFAAGNIREACKGCEWYGICSDIAAGGYDGVKLYPHDPD